jgi:feruloyl-CoA synthase
MDGTSETHAPFRDARYAPRALEVERRGDVLILKNPTPYSSTVQTVTAPLFRWSSQAPHRVWLAERPEAGGGEGWRTITYGDAAEQVMRLAGGLLSLGLARGMPLLILARNGIDHALISYAAMMLGAPIAPVSPQYGLKGADLSRLAFAVERIKPAMVYVDDAEAFGEALAGHRPWRA